MFWILTYYQIDDLQIFFSHSINLSFHFGSGFFAVQELYGLM